MENILKSSKNVISSGGLLLKKLCIFCWQNMATLSMALGALFFCQGLAHEMAGCYMLNVKANSSENKSNGTKACSTMITFPGSWKGPNQSIVESCTCKDVYTGVAPKELPPENLAMLGCDIAEPDARPCRDDEKSEGWEYKWQAKHWWGVLIDAIKTATNGATGCIALLSKLVVFVASHGGAMILVFLALCAAGFFLHHYQGIFGYKSSAGDAPSIHF